MALIEARPVRQESRSRVLEDGRMGRMGRVKSPEVILALLDPDAPGDTRCTRNDGKKWRCTETKVEGSRLCSRRGAEPPGNVIAHSKKFLGGTDGGANGTLADKEGSGSGHGDSLKKLEGGDANANVRILDAGVSGSGSGDFLKKLLGGGGGGGGEDANASGAVPDAGESGTGSGGGEMRVASLDRVASPRDDKTALEPATLPSSTGHAAPELDLRELKQMLQLKLAESTARVDEVNISYIMCFSVWLFGLHQQVSMKR